MVYDDYGHHPTAIRETLAAVRQREPGRRVWAVYEPLTYHRTAAMLDAFADALAERRRRRDRRHLGRPRPGHDDRLGGRPRRRRSRLAGPGIPVLAPGLRRGDRGRAWPSEVRAGDAVLVMGGGASYRIGERLLAATGGDAMIDYAAAGDWLEAYGAGLGRPSTATPGSRSSPRMPSTMRTRSARRSSGTTRCGHTCSTQPTSQTRRRVHGRAPLGLGARRSSRPGTRLRVGRAGRPSASGWPGS